jgi:hypothetical protein
VRAQFLGVSGVEPRTLSTTIIVRRIRAHSARETAHGATS